MHIKNNQLRGKPHQYDEYFEKERAWYNKHRRSAKKDPLKYWLNKPWLSQQIKDRIRDFFDRVTPEVKDDRRIHAIVGTLVYFGWRDSFLGDEGKRELRRPSAELEASLKNIDKGRRELDQVVRKIWNYLGPHARIKDAWGERTIHGGEFHIAPLADELQKVLEQTEVYIRKKKRQGFPKDIRRQLRGPHTQFPINCTLYIIWRALKASGVKECNNELDEIASAAGFMGFSKGQLRERLKNFRRNWKQLPSLYRKHLTLWMKVGWF